MLCVEVYGKRDCCLCEQVKATLLKVRRHIVFDLHEIDIESTPELYEAYKKRIPLVLINGRPAFKFRVEEEALRLRLTRERA
ncbi:MAG: glutaredoxin family protein [Candidatus Methylomirabilia bacterium]